MHWRMYLKQAVMSLKLYLRIPAALFWIFGFPIVMLLGLGTVFGSHGAAPPKLVWAEATPPSVRDRDLEAAFHEVSLQVEALTPEEADARWSAGKLPALLTSEAGEYKLRLNGYLGNQALQIESLVQQGFLLEQARARGVTDLARMPVVMETPGGHRDGPYAAFLLPGLLGLNVLTMGVFYTGISDVTMREKGGYKRLATTPLPRFVWLLAQLTVRLLVVLVSAGALMLVGSLVFGIHNQGAYSSVLLLLTLGSACFICMGYLLASFAGSVETYSGIANFAFLSLMLMSGVYFSIDAAPLWLQRVADLLPLAPLLTALRAVFNDGAALVAQGAALAIVGVWTVVLLIAATRRFRWV
jgi:ABC-type multidrug transport system permease subunit